MVQITSSRPRRPRRSHGDRKTEILRQAADAFRTHGFHGVGMREIAKTLGMTPGSLYYYFESKDDLLYVCQKTALTTLLAAARRAVRSTASPEAKIRAIVVAHLHCLLEETGGSAAHLEFRALPGARRAEIARQRDAYERLIGRIIGDGIAVGAFRPADPDSPPWRCSGPSIPPSSGGDRTGRGRSPRSPMRSRLSFSEDWSDVPRNPRHAGARRADQGPRRLSGQRREG